MRSLVRFQLAPLALLLVRAGLASREGRLVSLPAAWTSVSAPDPFVVIAAGRSAFRVPDLLELARLLASLQQGEV